MSLHMKRKQLAAYVFISPYFLLFGLFMVYPLFYALYLSFFSWPGTGPKQYVGIANFLRLFQQDPRFMTALYNTTYYAVGAVFFIVPLALVLAVLLNSKLTACKSLFRLSYFVPILTSTVVASIMFLLIYDREYGLINAVLKLLNLSPVNWLGRDMVKISVLLLCTWRYVGINILYFLAGLQSIPHELYEAAEIDGASAMGSFWFITLPLLKPVTFFATVMAIIGSYQIFAEPMLLAGGGPANSSLSITMYLHRTGFQMSRMGYAAAMGYVLSSIIFVLTLLQMTLFGQGKDGI